MLPAERQRAATIGSHELQLLSQKSKKEKRKWTLF
jgi:hypothetical protein